MFFAQHPKVELEHLKALFIELCLSFSPDVISCQASDASCVIWRFLDFGLQCISSNTLVLQLDVTMPHNSYVWDHMDLATDLSLTETMALDLAQTTRHKICEPDSYH